MSKPEQHLPPKGVAEGLESQYGLKLTPEYIRAIRRESIARNDALFAAGQARVSEVFAWIKANPKFRRETAGKRLAAGVM